MGNNLIDFKDDVFGRRNIAVNLTKILDNSLDINVIAIDSSWGTGKTTFVRMWQNMLSSEEEYKNKFETLYFNSWENDYIKNPLAALISAIEGQLRKEPVDKVKGLNHIKNNGKKLIIPVMSAAIKIATNGILDMEKIKLGEANEEHLADLINKIGEVTMEEIMKEKDARENFIKELEEYVDKNDIKIIFFIDELDRCRPTFAIELLEAIKHIFSVKNITFIISIDKEQLCHSISTLYGQEMDSHGYLRRFFDLEFKIPVMDMREYIKFKSEGIFKEFKETKAFQNFIGEIMVKGNYTLRDIDKAFKYIRVLLPTIDYFNSEDSKEDRDVYYAVYSYILAHMVNIKFKHSSVYQNILSLGYIADIDSINKMLNVNSSIMNLEFNIEGWAEEALQIFVTQQIVEKYLMAVKLTNNGNTPRQSNNINEEDYYSVGLKDGNGRFYGGCRVNLLTNVSNKSFDIISKMEFLDSII